MSYVLIVRIVMRLEAERKERLIKHFAVCIK